MDGEVEAEVTEECENFGKVTKVVIYQEKQSADPSAETIVKIFVQFGTPHEVQTAISGLVFIEKTYRIYRYIQSVNLYVL